MHLSQISRILGGQKVLGTRLQSRPVERTHQPTTHRTPARKHSLPASGRRTLFGPADHTALIAP